MDMLTVLSSVTAAVSPGGGGGVDTNSVIQNIRSFVGPIVLFVFGALALTFLIRRQVSAMIMFIVIGAVVFALFYTPEIVARLGETISGWF